MKILLLTQVVPFPPDSGPKVKTYNVLRYLARRHELHVASFVRSPAEVEQAQSLSGFCASVTTVPLHRSAVADAAYLLRSLATRRPFLVERDNSSAMRELVQRLVAKQSFDAVHADQISMAQFALEARVPLRVLDEHNAVWTIVRRAATRERGPRRLAAELEWRKMRAYEGAVCRQFTVTTVVSEEDRDFLEMAAGVRFPSAIIPITVDTAALHLVPRHSHAHDVVSIATMFYPPNVEGVHWFSTQVFPLIRRLVGDATFVIVGSRPPEEIRRLAHAGSGIVVTGYVADLQPVLERAGVLVVPVHSGSGMRVKILEAFARGIPVVSTTVGVEGIAAQPGEHLLIGDSPSEFAQAVARVLLDEGLARSLVIAARRLVENRYDPGVALAGLDAIYPG